jgi:hypothetical protein
MLQKTISVVRHRENVAGLQQVQTDGVVKTSPVRIAKVLWKPKEPEGEDVWLKYTFQVDKTGR